VKRGKSAREIPPPLELACLRELWDMGEGNVQSVRERLYPRRDLAYTTVMTMLDRLVRKQAVSRRKEGRSFVYTPVVTRDEIRRLAVRDLVDTLFGGSQRNLARWLDGKETDDTLSVDGPDDEPTIDTTLL
jgi:predicted transcriptional regulator